MNWPKFRHVMMNCKKIFEQGRLSIEVSGSRSSGLGFEMYWSKNRIGHCWTNRLDERTVEIADFKIDDRFRRRGNGSQLWKVAGAFMVYIYSGTPVNEFRGTITMVGDYKQMTSFWQKMGFKVTEAPPTERERYLATISKEFPTSKTP